MTPQTRNGMGGGRPNPRKDFRAAAQANLTNMMDLNRAARDILLDANGALSAQGTVLLDACMTEAGMDKGDFIPDPRLADFQMGKRAMVMFIMRLLNIDVAKMNRLRLLIKEDNDE